MVGPRPLLLLRLLLVDGPQGGLPLGLPRPVREDVVVPKVHQLLLRCVLLVAGELQGVPRGVPAQGEGDMVKAV